jgi:hypothetical protein
VSSGVVHGYWTGRWSGSEALDAAVSRLNRIPDTIGDWHGATLEIDQRQLDQGEIDGYVSRRYEDRQGGRAVTILLVCGRPGPISVHTPDVCYRGLGYVPAAPPSPSVFGRQAGGPAAEFTAATFERRQATTPQLLRILWSWNAGGSWEAPEYPRLRFASSQALYKLYVIREASPLGRASDDSDIESFLRLFLPTLDDALFS